MKLPLVTASVFAVININWRNSESTPNKWIRKGDCKLGITLNFV